MEIWKSVDGYPGYEVSNLGNVRSLDRRVQRGNHTKRMTGKQLTPVFIKTNGAYRVSLNKKKLVLIHRLVAMAFCEGYERGLQVNHKNGDRSDNRSENLEWVTPSENIQHSYDVLGRVAPCSGKFGKEAHASKAVVSIDMVTGERKRWGCAADAVRDGGFNAACISACCAGSRPHHKGHYWRFAD